MTTLEDNQFDHIFRNLQMSREEYIRDVTDKSLAILKRRYFPPYHQRKIIIYGLVLTHHLIPLEFAKALITLLGFS